VWAIVEDGFSQADGLLTSDPAIAAHAFSAITKELVFELLACTRRRSMNEGLSGEVYALSAAQPDLYTYRLVVIIASRPWFDDEPKTDEAKVYVLGATGQQDA
jgi:hypothetical protein